MHSNLRRWHCTAFREDPCEILSFKTITINILFLFFAIFIKFSRKNFIFKILVKVFFCVRVITLSECRVILFLIINYFNLETELHLPSYYLERKDGKQLASSFLTFVYIQLSGVKTCNIWSPGKSGTANAECLYAYCIEGHLCIW